MYCIRDFFSLFNSIRRHTVHVTFSSTELGFFLDFDGSACDQIDQSKPKRNIISVCTMTLLKLWIISGPRWIPIFGNLFLLKHLSRKFGGQHLALSKLAEQYKTNVLGLKLGKDYAIAVFSYDLVRQVLTEEEYEGRPDSFFIRLRSMGTRKGK